MKWEFVLKLIIRQISIKTHTRRRYKKCNRGIRNGFLPLHSPAWMYNKAQSHRHIEEKEKDTFHYFLL